MADSTKSSLADILSHIWALVLALFVGKTTSVPRSELPVDATRGTFKAQTPRSSECVIGKGQGNFLRHPSLRSKRKGRQKDTNTETRGKRHRSPSIHYFNSFVHRPQTGSTTIPVVIVTPSTPTGMLPVAEFLLPSLSSPLELADAIVEPSQHSVTQSVAENIGEMPLSLKKRVFVPDIENDISDVEFDSWTSSAAHAPLGEEEVDEPSFFLPEALQKITFEPIRCASHALSAVSDMLYDVPSWSGVEALAVGVPSYFTSTPPRRRRSAGTKLRDIENNYVEAKDHLEPPGDDAFYQCVDLIPYPDVFDLDMYYGATIPSKNDACEKPPSDGCMEKSEMTISSVVSSPPVTYHESEQPSYDNIHLSPPIQSTLENTSSPSPSILLPSQQQHRIPQLESIPLNESTNKSFEPSSIMTSPSFTLYSIEKSTLIRVKSQREPIYFVHDGEKSCSNHCLQWSRTSSDSEPESDADSMNALNTRLREAYDSFSAPTLTAGTGIPIPF